MKLEKYFETNKLVYCPYLLTGYPNEEKFYELVDCVVSQWAKIIELWIPFSDPISDGPVLTVANDLVVKNGVWLPESLDMINQVKIKYPDIGVVIMSYYNPIFTYKKENFQKYLAETKIDWFLIPDVPLEEYEELEDIKEADNVMIVSENLDNETIREIWKKTNGFLYVLSNISITGTDTDYRQWLSDFVIRLRNILWESKKLVVGFGIKDQKDIDFLKTLQVDGFIIWSGIVKNYMENGIEGVKGMKIIT